MFFFCGYAFGVISTKFLSNSRSQKFFSLFYFKSLLFQAYDVFWINIYVFYTVREGNGTPL